MNDWQKADATRSQCGATVVADERMAAISPAGLGRGVPAGLAAPQRWCRKSLRRGQPR